MTDTAALLSQLPDTPAARHLVWWLGMVASDGAGASPADRDRFVPALQDQLARLFDPATLQEAWARDTARLGVPTELAIVRQSDHEIVVEVATANDRKWTMSVAVEPEPPHRAAAARIDRRHDFQLDVREAGPDDAPVCADIERRCPIVMGETSVWFDRGEAYFDATRLMEDCTVGIASVEGVPAAVTCGAEHRVLVGGQIKSLVTVSHLRVLPEHQRKGLWGAANRVLEKYWPRVDGSSAYIATANLGMQHGFANTPDKWPQIVQRVELDCARLVDPLFPLRGKSREAGMGVTVRAATAADAPQIVGLLNSFHRSEELFVPYDAAGFARRLERAPDLYGWDKVWMTDRAVVGVWPAGNAQRTVTETPQGRTVTVPAVVLDYAFEPGAETELEALLRAWCGWLAPKGMDTVVIYTSPASTGSALITSLARATVDFFMWTPGIPVPPGAETRGLYTDAVYF
jgi:hypothetical protein